MLALGPAAAPAASADGPVLVDRRGDWDLRRLGATGFDLPTDAKRSGHSIELSFPPGARQGPDRWYLIRLHFEVQLSRRTGSGFVYMGGATNGRAGELVELRVRRRAARPLRIAWNSLDLIRGAATGTVRGRTVELDVQNYLQNKGVRPGRNVLTFDVEWFGHIKLERVRIFADSGLRVSDRSPAHLVLATSLPSDPVREGESFDIGYTLRNNGDRAAHKVGVTIEPSSPALRIVGAPRHIRRALPGGDRLSGRFRVQATRRGRFRLEVHAGAENTNSPLDEIVVPIHGRATQQKTSRPETVIPVGGGVAVVGLALVSGARTRLGRRRRSGD